MYSRLECFLLSTVGVLLSALISHGATEPHAPPAHNNQGSKPGLQRYRTNNETNQHNSGFPNANNQRAERPNRPNKEEPIRDNADFYSPHHFEQTPVGANSNTQKSGGLSENTKSHDGQPNANSGNGTTNSNSQFARGVEKDGSGIGQANTNLALGTANGSSSNVSNASNLRGSEKNGRGNGNGSANRNSGNSNDQGRVNSLELLEKASHELKRAHASLANANGNQANGNGNQINLNGNQADGNGNQFILNGNQANVEQPIHEAIRHIETVMHHHHNSQINASRSGVSGVISGGAHNQHHRDLEEALHASREAIKHLEAGEHHHATEEVARAHRHVLRAINSHKAMGN